MTENRVELQRNGQGLGSLPVAEVQTLLEAGFLRPTDEFLTADHLNWQTLAQFGAKQAADSASLADRIKEAVAKATKPTGRFIEQVATKTAKLRNVPQAALSQATRKVMTDYLPSLQELTRAQVTRAQHAGNTALRDEEFLRKLFGAIYDSLPRPIYRFVTEPQFIEFCLRHQHRLLGGQGSKPD